MWNRPLLHKESDNLLQNWNLLTDRLSALEKQEILENRAEEKLRLHALIEETRTQRDQVEQKLKALGVCRTSRKNDPCDIKKDFISGSWGLFLPKSGGFYRFIPPFRPSGRKDASN